MSEHRHEHAPEPRAAQSLTAVPRVHWTSLAELNGSAEVARRRGEEFYDKPAAYYDATGWSPDGLNSRPGPVMEAAGFMELAVKNNGGGDQGFSRRDFLKLSGAAMAFATAGCGLRPAEKIIPFVKADERVVPGVATYYASSLGDAVGTGVLIRTREGRPVKLEGNPDHPLTRGRLDAAGQVSIFNLYDPDRLTGPIKQQRGGGEPQAIPWPTADDEIAKALTAPNAQIVLLTGTVNGPARRRLIAEFLSAFPGARHVMFDGWNSESTCNAQEKCYGTKVLPRYRFDRAEYILSLNADPLGSGYSALEWQVGFGELRKVRDGKLNKLVAFEPCLTITGSSADERFRIRPGDATKVAIAIAKNLLAIMPPDAAIAGRADIESVLARYSVSSIETEAALPQGTIQRIAQELWKHRGQSIVFGGEVESLQAIVNLLNTLLGNDGRTVDTVVAPSQQSLGSGAELLALINDMKAGKVTALITFGTNPGFTLPESAGFADGMKKVKTTVSLADRVDETAIWCDYVLPGLHDMESWGDNEPQAGLYGLVQPTIMPLYDCRGWESSLLAFAVAAKAGPLSGFVGDWRTYMMDTWNRQIWSQPGRYEATFDDFWSGALRAGVVNTIVERDTDRRLFKVEALTGLDLPQVDRGGLELVVYPSPNLRDGGHANNAWLLELPDPVSRICWTNYASMSEATAKQLGVNEGDFIMLDADGNSAEIQAHIQVGDTDGVISVQSGWGRRRAGRVGDDTGVNAFVFRQVKHGKLLASSVACQASKTGRWEELPCVQGHNYVDGRHILYETSLEEYRKNPKAGLHGHEPGESMWGPGFEYKGYRWGMAIDLTACIGCNACIVACQVENNIPVVGKEQIQKGREMHWIRIDRYYSGDRENPETAFEPMLCQHCENAPCETVCPVLATVHDDEGLNQQTYNRCVGTRYCSNNCPYKVRRFNWHEFTFAAYDEHPLELALNPDVTVREKGVMEKCTFCHQRIRDAKRTAKDLGRTVHDTDLQTACQQTCPTGAITFGDMNNPDSLVSQATADPRGFHVLEELNVKPSITYHTKIRNRAPLADADHGTGHDGYHERKEHS
ncbi:4Fe-4S dicluster domain-containing protein [candidate division KSB1 bacterium]|nr:4Fe-4S dicluster domain-containing protein [candidate division KSB1 bacterium]